MSGQRYYSSGSGYTLDLLGSQSSIGVNGWQDQIKIHVLKEPTFSGGIWNSGNTYKNRIDAIEFICGVLGIDISSGYITSYSGSGSGVGITGAKHPASSGSYLSGMALNIIDCVDQSENDFFINLQYGAPQAGNESQPTDGGEVVIDATVNSYTVTGTHFIDKDGFWQPADIDFQRSGSDDTCVLSKKQMCQVTTNLQLLTKRFRRVTTVNPTTEAIITQGRVNVYGGSNGGLSWTSGQWKCTNYTWQKTKNGLYSVNCEWTYRDEGWNDIIFPTEMDTVTGEKVLIAYPDDSTGYVAPTYDTLPRPPVTGSGASPYYNKILANQKTCNIPSWINIGG